MDKPLKLEQAKIVSKDYNEKINGKVDKEEGKVLSSNDYTDEDKALVVDYGMQIAELFGLAEKLEELI